MKPVGEGSKFSFLPFMKSGSWVVKVEEEGLSSRAVWRTGWAQGVERSLAKKSALAKGNTICYQRGSGVR